MTTAPDSPTPTPSAYTSAGGWRSTWWSVIRFGLCVMLIGSALSLSVIPWSDLSWWRIFRRCVSIAAAISLWLCVRTFEKRSIRSYGFSASKIGKHQLALGLLIGLGALGVMFGVGLAVGVYRFEVTPDRVRLWRIVLSFLPAAGLISVLEELVFRGFILQHLMMASRILAVLTSSILYAVVHLKHPTVTLATSLELGGLFLLGVVLALSYLQTGQLYFAVGLHAAFAYGARVNKLLIQFPDPSLLWLVGTSRLINSLLSWIVLLGIGGIVMWLAQPSHEGGVRHEET